MLTVSMLWTPLETRMQEARSFLWLHRNASGHLAPGICKGTGSAACCVPGVLLRHNVGTEANVVCWNHKPHSREQETRTCCRNSTSMQGGREDLSCMTEINQWKSCHCIWWEQDSLLSRLVLAGEVMRLLPLRVTVNLDLGGEGWKKGNNTFHTSML